MYKYLKNKIENSHGARVENLVFIINEYMLDSQSEVFEDFGCLEAEEICSVLGWRKDKDVFFDINSRIEDSELSMLMYENNKTGFLAECYFPEVSNFKFSEDKKPTSWSIINGCCKIEWIYADTIEELFEKLQTKSEKIFNEKVSEFLNSN